MRIVFLAGLVGVGSFGCASGPTAQETLPQLKAAIFSEVGSPDQNQQNSDLVSVVSREKHIHGLTRAELEKALGRGDRCANHPLCDEKGFFDDDWYYEVGQPGEQYVRRRPILLVGFSRFGKVERTFVREVR